MLKQASGGKSLQDTTLEFADSINREEEDLSWADMGKDLGTLGITQVCRTIKGDEECSKDLSNFNDKANAVSQKLSAIRKRLQDQ